MADESYYWYKSHGICVKCKKNDASPNRIMCDECREKWNAIRREKIKDPEYKKWKKQYNKKHKEKMLENGLCPMCGKPLYQGHKTCYEHWLKNRKRWKRYEENHRGTIRNQWREAGLCLNYGKHFRRDDVLGSKGIRSIYGKTGAESIPMLEKSYFCTGR